MSEATQRTEKGTSYVGWNPASNSEGGEGFVVREVQGTSYVLAGFRGVNRPTIHV